MNTRSCEWAKSKFRAKGHFAYRFDCICATRLCKAIVPYGGLPQGPVFPLAVAAYVHVVFLHFYPLYI